MEYQDILKILAPCGLSCRKCFAFSEGEIKMLSTKLQELLGSFGRYAERFSVFLPVFKNYSSFKELLAYFTQSDCNGCRRGNCKYPNCGIISCYQKMGVDFCFQCDEFPCKKLTLTLTLNVDGFKWIIGWRRSGLNLIFKKLRTYRDTGKAKMYVY